MCTHSLNRRLDLSPLTRFTTNTCHLCKLEREKEGGREGVSERPTEREREREGN